MLCEHILPALARYCEGRLAVLQDAEGCFDSSPFEAGRAQYEPPRLSVGTSVSAFEPLALRRATHSCAATHRGHAAIPLGDYGGRAER
jgi:hypothetical protein